MAKRRRKPASALTTEEVLQRLFGKRGATKIRQVLDSEDAKKGPKTRKKSNG